MSLADTPRGNRLHIGIFGKRNAGKSSLINALTGQDAAIVSPEAGTTTDPVFKAMEFHPIGPVVFIDTAGFDDEGQVGRQRIDRAQAVLARTDIAILVMDGEELAAGEKERAADSREAIVSENQTAADSREAEAGQMQYELDWIRQFQAREIPVILVINKWETLKSRGQRTALSAAGKLHSTVGSDVKLIPTSAATGEGIEELRKAIAMTAPNIADDDEILRSLLPEKKLVLLVMPQDIQAPKGRLILPQVQTTRALLDRKCTVVSTTADEYTRSLTELGRAPDLIITDSQCFSLVWEGKPEVSELTSFSILMAKVKGDIDVFVDGAKAIDDLVEKTGSTELTDPAGGSDVVAFAEPAGGSDVVAFADPAGGKRTRILIAEACTHVPQGEDIGTVKIPNLLRKKLGDEVEIVNVRGNDFPDIEELKSFDLIIHCGACMFNRRHVMSRIAAAAEAGVPITNYGVFLAKMSGILEKL